MIDGKTIAITRSKEDSEEFIELVSKENAKPITLPTIELVSKGEKIVDEFLDTIQKENPDYSVFMSSKAVTLLIESAKKTSKFQSLPLEKENIKVAYMPERHSSVGIGEVFTKLNAVGKKSMIPRSGSSTPFLKNLLEKIGVQVVELYLYDVCAFRDPTEWNEFRQMLSENKIDGVIFTSASSVRAFFEIMINDYNQEQLIQMLEQTKVIAIGPFTADELKKFNVQNIIANVHTVKGSVEAVLEAFSLA